MAKKEARTLPHIRYANLDIFVEEAIRIENHSPAMVVLHEKGKERIRIIPSKKWDGEAERIDESLSGLFSHETLHIWLGRVFGKRTTKKLDNLPKPKNGEEYMSGVFGWNLGGDKTSKLES